MKMALTGLRVIEMAGLAPAPFCGMILADFGASVIRVDKVNPAMDMDSLSRGKRSIAINLKNEAGVSIVKKLCANSDVLIEPFRRGVMEKLGLGPEVMLTENPRLIFARLTGFGQSGPYADRAGHDINYIALSGLLSTIGRAREKPLAPINLLADFAGGGLVCAMGICMALLERERSGLGQVIDSNMVEGSAYVGSWLYKSQDKGIWSNPRGENLLDSGAHFYETYKTKDDKYMAVGALEPQFYAEFVKGLGLNPEDLDQYEFAAGKERLNEIFATKTAEEWTRIFETKDACVFPVLDLNEAPLHPHNKNSFLKTPTGNFEPRPAPYLMRTPAKPKLRSPRIGQHTKEILAELSYEPRQIAQLLENGTIQAEITENSKL